MGMEAGKLRHRVIRQSPTATLDAMGQPVKTWATVDTVWASVEPIDAAEVLLEKGFESRTRFTITMRSAASPTNMTDWRFQHRSRNFFPISQANRGEKNEMLQFICVEDT